MFVRECAERALRASSSSPAERGVTIMGDVFTRAADVETPAPCITCREQASDLEVAVDIEYSSELWELRAGEHRSKASSRAIFSTPRAITDNAEKA